MNLLRSVGRIKAKLGIVIVLAVVTAYVVNELGIAAGITSEVRLVIATLLSLGMVQLTATGMTRPLREMAAGAGKIAAGNYDLRVHTMSRDEVGELAVAFNSMAADLGRVDLQRRELVANVSHELRTPIAALQAVLENVVDGVSEPDRDTLGTALSQTERLGRLVTQLLDLSRLESGARRIDSELVDLTDLCEQAIREATFRAPTARTQLDVPAEMAIRADPDLLAQVLQNLLDNAIRHSPGGGVVTLTARAEGPGVRIAVADKGPGVPEESRTRIFERFSRLDEGRTTDQGGSGLGLAITREIVELHHGLIFVDPAYPDGCRMVVDLPGRTGMNDTPARPGPIAGTASAGVVAGPLPGAKGTPAESARQKVKLPKAPRRLLPAAGVVGVVAGASLPSSRPGIGIVLVAIALGAITVPIVRRRPNPWMITFALLAYGLTAMAFFRDAGWLLSLVLPAAVVLGALAISGRSRGWLEVLTGSFSVAASAIHVPRFLAEPLKRVSSRLSIAPTAIGIAITAILVFVFGTLFSEADEVFHTYARQLLTSTEALNAVPLRILFFLLFGGVAAAAVLAAIRPPKAGPDPDLRHPVNRAIWVYPLVALDLMFAGFVLVQLTSLFGGREYVEETTGLTYAEYARSGFFQLVWISVIVLVIVAAVAGLLHLEGRDRLLAGGLLGLLCALTVVALISAHQRLDLYIEMYGLSRLRASVGAAIWWLGAIFVLVLIAGGLRLAKGTTTSWLPRALVAATGAGLLAFAVWNPELRIAETQMQVRGEARLDRTYLRDLGVEAVPALDRLPEPTRSCVLELVVLHNDLDEPETWGAWNLARTRARDVLARNPVVDRAVGECTTE